MTIESPNGRTITLPDMPIPEACVTWTSEFILAFAQWQNDCLEALDKQGLSGFWIHDELSICEKVQEQDVVRA